MSTERECVLLAGGFLHEMFTTAYSVAKDLGVAFPYNDMYDWREEFLADAITGECDFCGYPLTEDYEDLDLDELSNEYAVGESLRDRATVVAAEFEKRGIPFTVRVKPVIVSF